MQGAQEEDNFADPEDKEGVYRCLIAMTGSKLQSLLYIKKEHEQFKQEREQWVREREKWVKEQEKILKLQENHAQLSREFRELQKHNEVLQKNISEKEEKLQAYISRGGKGKEAEIAQETHCDIDYMYGDPLPLSAAATPLIQRTDSEADVGATDAEHAEEASDTEQERSSATSSARVALSDEDKAEIEEAKKRRKKNHNKDIADFYSEPGCTYSTLFDDNVLLAVLGLIAQAVALGPDDVAQAARASLRFEGVVSRGVDHFASSKSETVAEILRRLRQFQPETANNLLRYKEAMTGKVNDFAKEQDLTQAIVCHQIRVEMLDKSINPVHQFTLNDVMMAIQHASNVDKIDSHIHIRTATLVAVINGGSLGILVLHLMGLNPSRIKRLSRQEFLLLVIAFGWDTPLHKWDTLLKHIAGRKNHQDLLNKIKACDYATRVWIPALLSVLSDTIFISHDIRQPRKDGSFIPASFHLGRWALGGEYARFIVTQRHNDETQRRISVSFGGALAESVPLHTCDNVFTTKSAKPLEKWNNVQIGKHSILQLRLKKVGGQLSPTELEDCLEAHLVSWNVPAHQQGQKGFDAKMWPFESYGIRDLPQPAADVWPESSSNVNYTWKKLSRTVQFQILIALRHMTTARLKQCVNYLLVIMDVIYQNSLQGRTRLMAADQKAIEDRSPPSVDRDPLFRCFFKGDRIRSTAASNKRKSIRAWADRYVAKEAAPGPEAETAESSAMGQQATAAEVAGKEGTSRKRKATESMDEPPRKK